MTFRSRTSHSSLKLLLRRDFPTSRSLGVTLASAIFCLSCVLAGATAQGQAKARSDRDLRGRSTPALRSSLAFEPNVGQVHSSAKFVSHGPGFDVALQSDSVILNFKRRAEVASSKRDNAANAAFGKDRDSSWPVAIHLLGAKVAPQVAATEKLVGTSSYFPSSDKRTWRTNVPMYGRVTYAAVYPGVDLTFYGRDSRLEYDLSLAPATDPRSIKMQLAGIEGASIDLAGNLHLRGPRLGNERTTATFLKPVAFQLLADGKTRETVQVDYGLRTHGAHGIADVTFNVGKYDRSRPLVIDPVLSYGEYLPSGTSGYSSSGVSVDSVGDVYTVLSEGSVGFSVIEVDTQGNLLKTISVGSNVTISQAYALALDSKNDIYVTGVAVGGLPTTASAFQANPNGSTQDAFLTVLKADGSGIAYSTYFGGSGSETGETVAVDSAGDAYIAGYTSSADLPTTGGTFQSTYPKTSLGANSGFVAKFNPSASGTASLIYSTYLGSIGPDADFLYALAVDSTGSAYLTGSLFNGFPVVGGGYDYASFGATANASMVYAIELKPDASALVYSAQIGPGTGNGIAIDGAGAAYIAGLAAADDFPTTAGAYDVQYPGPFATKLSADGKTLLYSTFLGGPSTANTMSTPATAIALPRGCASNCAATVAGLTDTLDLPLVNPIDSVPGDASYPDAFLVQLAPDGTSATLSTYFGEAGGDVLTYNLRSPAVALDSAGNVLLTLNAGGAPDLPSTSPLPANHGIAYLARIAPAAASLALFTPSALDLGSPYVGQTTRAGSFSVTLRNLGSKPIGSLAISIDDAEFAETDTCGTTLAAGAQCILQLAFTPAVVGSRSAALTVTSDAPDNPVVASLTGTGSDSAYLRFSSPSLNFGDVTLNTSSPTQSFTITNVGSEPATFSSPFSINSVPTINAFNIVTDCPAALGVGASCTAAVAFSPLQAGVYTGLAQNSFGSPSDQLALTGTGVASGSTGTLIVSSSTANFGTSPVGTTAQLARAYIYLVNNGTVPVTIGALSLARLGATDYTADFSIANTSCTTFYSLQTQTPQSLDPQSSCYIYLNFTPSAVATESAQLNFSNSTAVDPIAVTLVGTGTAAAQTLTFAPSAAAFGDQPLGYAGNPQTFFVGNSGNTNFVVDRVIATGDFLVSNNGCTGIIYSGSTGNCYIYVTFRPTALGPRSGTLTIYDTAGNPQTLTLTGNGIPATGSLTLQNAPLVFTAQAKGTTGPSQFLYLVNTGNTPVQASTVAVTGDFAITYDVCAGTLIAARQTCEVDVAFTPMQSSGEETGTLTIATAAGNFSAPLTGEAESASQAIAFTPVSLDFGSVQTGLTSYAGIGYNPQVWVRNTGTEPVDFTASPTVGANFSVAQNSCGGSGSTLAPNASCEIDVQFNAPPAAGISSTTLTLSDSAGTGTQSIPITATAVAAPPSTYFQPTEYAFTQQPIGSTSSNSQAIYLENTTATPITIASVTVTGDFLLAAGSGDCLSNGLPAETTAGQPGFCYTVLQFAPTAVGYRTGTLTLKDTSNKTYSIPLAGFATAQSDSAVLSQDTLVFDDEVAGVPLANIHADSTQLIALLNTGNLPLTVGTLSGAVADDFTLQSPGTDSCSNVTVPPNGRCYITVAFVPSTPGHKTGTIELPVTYTDGSKATLALALTGNGLAPVEHATLSPASTQFADQTVGVVYPTVGADAPFRFTLTNDGNISLTVGQFSLTDSTDFSFASPYGTDACSGVTIAPAQTCYVSVLFQPATPASKSATATLPFHYNDSTATAASFSATITGNGVAPSNTTIVTPAVAQFPAEVVDTQDNPLTFTIANDGNRPVVMGRASVSSNFTLNSDQCSGVTVNPGFSCLESVQFTPMSSSPAYTTTTYTGTLTVPVVGGATLTSALSGTGIPATQQVVLSQSTIDFGNVNVATSSPQLSAQVVDRGPALSGTGAVAIASVVLGGANASDFSLQNGCPLTLQGRSTCLLYATFSPSAASVGNRSASVTVTYGGGRTLVLSLTGNGANPVPQATVFPAAIQFGSQGVGTTSLTQTFDVTDTGSANLILGALAYSNSATFPIQFDTCSHSTLTPSQRCQVGIAFDPSVAGPASGSVSIPSNAATQSVSLAGTGSGGPQVSLTPGSLSFANQAVATTSPSQSIAVKNTGAASLTGLSISLGGIDPGDFVQTSTCPSTLPASASCSVSIAFDPAAIGTRSATLSFNDSASGSPQRAALSGTGIQETQTISFPALSSTSYGAAPFVLGATATSGLPVAYTVTGPATVSGSVVSITGAGAVKVTASQPGNANFAAATPVSQSFTVTPAPLTVTASNASRVFGAPNPTFVYTIAGFQYNDTTSVVGGSATLTSAANPASPAGNYPITFSTQALTAANYTFSYLPGTLTVTAGVAATPVLSAGTGTYTSAQTITIADATPSPTIYYTTDGSAPNTNSTRYTGAVSIGTNQTLKAAAIATGYTLSGDASATYTFVPVMANPATLAFGSQSDDSTSASKTVTLSNPGLNSIAGFTASISGPNAADFSIVSNGACGGTIAAGGSCAYSVTFTPRQTGTRAASLVVGYNGVASPVTIALSGTGLALSPGIVLTPSTSTYGQIATVAVALNGNPTPTGSLTYSVDGAAARSVAIQGNQVVLNAGTLAAGTHAVVVGYSGDGIYASESLSVNLSLAKAPLTATAASFTRQFNTPNPTLTYAVTGFVNGDTSAVVLGTATLSTTAVVGSNAGTYPVTFATEALVAANYTFSYVAGTITVLAAAPQTIAFGPLPATVYGSAPFVLGATATSGLPVGYTVSGPASVSGSTLAITGTGMVTVTASQPGNANYAAASPVTQTFAVAKAVLTATAASLSRQYGTPNPPLTYSVTGFVAADTISVVTGSATLSTTATTASPTGTYPITFATKGLAAANYTFTYLPGTLTVSGGTAQTIAFAPIPNTTYGAPALTLSATASSGLQVSYAVGGPAILSGSTLTVTGAGPVTVTATQVGNSNYAAAPSVAQSFTVAKAILSVTATSLARQSGTPNPALTYSISGFVKGDTAAVVSGGATLTTTAMTGSPAGTYPITFSTETLMATNYGFTYVAGTLTVTPSTIVAAPTFSPSGGVFTNPQTVMLNDASTGAAIHYTLDGSIPTAQSALYTAPIQVGKTETIDAIAILNGASSGVASAAFTIGAAQCQTIDYSKGFTAAGLSLNGGATVNGSSLQITDGGRFEARSAFYSSPLPMSNFTTDFTFQILNPIADGFTFAIQSIGPHAVGQTGGGLGYAGIQKSAALKFDLHNNSGEGNDSTGTYVDGAFPSTPAFDLSSTGIDLHSGHIFAVHLVYENAVTVGSITDTETGVSVNGSLPGNISDLVGNDAYVGFTGGTGNSSANQSILSWTFSAGTGCAAK